MNSVTLVKLLNFSKTQFAEKKKRDRKNRIIAFISIVVWIKKLIIVIF